jgi:hypothetical protein
MISPAGPSITEKSIKNCSGPFSRRFALKRSFAGAQRTQEIALPRSVKFPPAPVNCPGLF